MNNLKYYNDSLAYDFEMFMPKHEETQKNNIVTMPASITKKRRKIATKTLSIPAFIIMCTAFVLAGFCGNIFLRLQINEVNSEINNVKSSIAELQSVKTELEVEMQRRISYSNLELEALQLGMQKPDKEDITYIRVNDVNAAETADGTVLLEE